MLATFQPLEQRVGLVDVRRRGTILARRGARAVRAQMLRDHVHAVANAENRQPGLQHFRVDIGGVLLVETGGSARQDDATGLHRANLLERKIKRVDLAVHPASRTRRAISWVYWLPKSRIKIIRSVRRRLSTYYSQPRNSGE